MNEALALIPGAQSQIAGAALTWAARQFGERPAILFEEHTLSYQELEQRSNRLARALIALGLQPGTRIAILVDNSVESIEITFAAEKAALPYVPLNTRHKAGEHSDIIEHSGVELLVVGPGHEQMATALMESHENLHHVVSCGETFDGSLDYEALIAAQKDDDLPGIEIGPQHIIRFAYTSGTTGRPKGVIYSHQRWYTRLANHFYAMEYGLGVEDAMIHVGPLTHAAGVHLLPCYLRGARNIIHRKFDAGSLLEDIARHRASHIMVVPTMLESLIEAVGNNNDADLSSLKRIHFGTAPTRPETISKAIETFGPILRQQYGMTEIIQPIAVLYPHELEQAIRQGDSDIIKSCGKPALNIHLAIHDKQGQEVSANQVGEIAIAHAGSAEVAYWEPREIEKQSIRNGWFYTGDLGRVDDSGFLHIVGRNRDMIISGGFNVYAVEVENTLASHEAVEEVAVIGIPDSKWGECVTAIVVRRKHHKVDAEELADHCNQRIAGYKKPRRIEFVDQLPRNANGKVVKDQLRALFEDKPNDQQPAAWAKSIGTGGY
jgi:acyl-CoA synthetase (AMP-forming)/AMP-acid ligase II